MEMNKKVMRAVMALAILATVGSTSIKADASTYVPNEAYDFFLYQENEVENADYSALFIGNSITWHPVCDYWWGSWGMAASTAENDYVHKVVAGLKETYNAVDYDIISYSVWERKNVRGIALPKIDGILENDYDLVVIQLGENAKSTATFEADYEQLVQYVKAKQPNAKNVLVGDFWVYPGRDAMKINVATRQNCTYIDISDIRTNKKYQSFVGDKVYGDDGKLHKIDFPPVAIHPNDLTYQCISERILGNIEK